MFPKIGTQKWMVCNGNSFLKWMIWRENPLFFGNTHVEQQIGGKSSSTKFVQVEAQVANFGDPGDSNQKPLTFATNCILGGRNPTHLKKKTEKQIGSPSSKHPTSAHLENCTLPLILMLTQPSSGPVPSMESPNGCSDRNVGVNKSPKSFFAASNITDCSIYIGIYAYIYKYLRIIYAYIYIILDVLSICISFMNIQ